MKKYRVAGTTTVTVYKEVWAANEEDAIDKASELNGLTAYCGNFGFDKLVGVDGEDESVDADGYIEWNDTEVIEEDDSYFECPSCGNECYLRKDIEGDEYWYCDECDTVFNTDGYEEYHIEFEEEE